VIDRGRVQRSIDELLAEHESVPGVVVTLSDRASGCTVASGWADRGANRALGPNDTFRVASVTKTFVAVSSLILAEQRLLRIDDPLDERLPPMMTVELARAGYDVAATTIEHLLRHTSGLYDFGTDRSYLRQVRADPQHRWSAAEQIDWALAHGRPLGRPGERFGYSDTGYVVAARIIEAVAGVPLPAAFRSLLRFERIGLHSTWMESLEPPPSGAGDRAHQLFGDTDCYGFDPSCDLWGGGGLVSTTSDLARFARLLLDGSLFDERGSLDAMLRPTVAEGALGWGMGVFPLAVDGGQWWGHTGYWGVAMGADRTSSRAGACANLQGSPPEGADPVRILSRSVASGFGGGD
jgi:D-alanyl-D-alanine carboxypeptidase